MFPHEFFGLAFYGNEYFPGGSGVVPPPVVVRRDLGARFEWTERRTRVRKRMEREIPAPALEAALDEIDELPLEPTVPQLREAVERIARTLGPSWDQRYHALLESEIRLRPATVVPPIVAAIEDPNEITDDELEAIVLLLSH